MFSTVERPSWWIVLEKFGHSLVSKPDMNIFVSVISTSSGWRESISKKLGSRAILPGSDDAAAQTRCNDGVASGRDRKNIRHAEGRLATKEIKRNNCGLWQRGENTRGGGNDGIANFGYFGAQSTAACSGHDTWTGQTLSLRTNSFDVYAKCHSDGRENAIITLSAGPCTTRASNDSAATGARNVSEETFGGYGWLLWRR